MSATETPARPVSIRRRVVLALLALVAVLFAVGLVQHWRGDGGELDRLIAGLDESDPNWRLEDIDTGRAEVPEADNSARLIAPLANRVPSGWPAWEAISPPEGTPFNERLDAARLAKLIEQMGLVEPLRGEARKLIDMPRGRHRLTWDHTNPMMTLLTDQHQTRRVSGLLHYDAVELAHAGDISGAIRSAHACLNVSRSLGDEPMLISQLIRAAGFMQSGNATERALALGEADERTLANLQTLLLDDEKHNGLLCAWRGERAGQYALLRNLADGKLKLRDFDFGGLPPGLLLRDRVMPWSIRKTARDEQVVLLKMSTRALDIARLPAHEQTAEAAELEKEVRTTNASLVAALFPPHRQMGEAHLRKLAHNRILIVLLAVERFRLKAKRWPADLGELKPAYLGEVPLDPYDGKPLRFKKVADGVAVYSVGQDGTDDGGNLDRGRMPKGTDLGYRLWDVGARNKSAGGK